MKRTLNFVLAALIVAVMCAAAVAPVFAAEPDKSQPIAYAVYGTPEIDGEIDAVWDNAKPRRISKTFVTNGPDPDNPTNGTSAVFRALWDEKYL